MGFTRWFLVRELSLLRVRWPGSVARSEGIGNANKILFSKPDGRDTFEDLYIDDIETLKWILNRSYKIDSFGSG